jgi:tetratricopeptide (TPR) repeat protein
VPEPDPLVIPEPEKWPIYERYVPQVISLMQKSLQPLPVLGRSLEFSMLLNDVSSYMWYQGLNIDCQTTTEVAESILDELHYDINSKLRWDLHIIRGILCTFTGLSKREEGFERRRRSLAICDHFQKLKKMPIDDVLTMRCISLADLAIAYLEDENFEEVERLMQECGSIYAKLGTEQELPFHWGRFYHHRSYGEAAQGRYIKALQMCQHAAELQEQHSGVGSTHTQDYRFTIAEMLYHAGDLQQSLNIHNDVLNARLRLDGHFNHRTLTSYFISGILQWRLGDLDLAE